MGCICENFDGDCSLYEEGHPASPRGCPEGFCVVSDDPDPADSCENYESDWTCPECGADLNIEDCDCEDE